MKLLICQSCGVVIRTKGKHCTGCGIQLALNTPTQMTASSVERPPLAVRYSQDHLLLERVVTGRQLSALTLRPQISSSPMFDDGGEEYSSGYGGSYSAGFSNADRENGGNGGNGYGNGGNGGNGGSSPYSSYTAEPSQDNAFGWNNPAQASTMTAAEGRFVDPNSAPSQDYQNVGMQALAQPVEPQPASSFGGFFAPSGGTSTQYYRSASDSVELVESVEPDPLPVQNKAVEALSKLTFEDGFTEPPSMPEPQAPMANTSSERVEDSGSVANPTMHLAGFGAHPGAAISIAIGAGVGALANQMLTKRSLPEESRPAKVEPAPADAGRAAMPLERASDPVESTPAAGAEAVEAPGSVSQAVEGAEDFFAASKSELEDFFGPQSKAEPEPIEMEPQSETAAVPAPVEAVAAAPIRQAPEETATVVLPKDSNLPETLAAAPEPKKDSGGFFGDDDGGFDFFSSPASPSARKAAFSEESEQESNLPAGAAPPVEASAPAKAEPTLRERETTVDASGAQDRPHVAMPKSLTQSKTKLKVSEPESPKPGEADDDEDDDDEDSEEAKVSPPKRRSFSGDSPVAASRKSPNRKPAKPSKDDDDEDEIEPPGGALNWLEEEVKFLGLNVSRKTAGVLVAVGVFILVQIPGWFMSFANVATGGGGASPQTAQAPQQQQQPAAGPFGLGNRGQGQPVANNPGMMPQGPGMPGMAPGQQPGQVAQFPGGAPPNVGGQWEIEVVANGQPFRGMMAFNQGSNQFSGRGQDSAGTFDIVGQLNPPDTIIFNKKYDQESRHKLNAHNEDIYFQGKLIPFGGLYKAIGAYQTQRKIGSSFSTLKPARIIPIKGEWRALQKSVVASNPQTTPGGFAIPGIQNKLQPPQIATQPISAGGRTDVKKMHDFFLMIALGLVALGVLIFLFFLALFGPSGWMNVWEKQKYIPSQFVPDHMKMVREYGRPLKPGGTPFGRREEWGWWCFWTPKYLSLTPEARKANPHMLFLGGGDKGKTRLMASMITHDIKSEDRAVVVIDSDGQLCDLIVEWIASQPEGAKYAKRVVLVDPTYKAGSLAYNPLEMPDDCDLQAASSAIVHGFKAIYTEPPGSQSQWNAQTANILRNAALLLMANGRTLTDLPNLLQDNDFRDIMLEAVERKKNEKTEYITILESWNQYKKLARTDQWINWVEPILNRVGPMLSDGRIRPILTKPVSDLKLREIIRKKKILIVKVPQGELDQNANLLGSLIVTGLQQAAMSLAKDANDAERPVALYLDEMDSFIEKETIENITSETRRYQIGFVGSIKTLQHLPEDYRNQLVINMGTMAIFALSKKDGDMLGPQMFRVDGRKIKHQTIANFFNKVNTSPQFELIMDEEKLNIDRIVGQEIQTFFCYRVGTVAGVFKLKAFDFKDMPEKKINRKLVEKMHAITDGFDKKKGKEREKEDKVG